MCSSNFWKSCEEHIVCFFSKNDWRTREVQVVEGVKWLEKRHLSKSSRGSSGRKRGTAHLRIIFRPMEVIWWHSDAVMGYPVILIWHSPKMISTQGHSIPSDQLWANTAPYGSQNPSLCHLTRDSVQHEMCGVALSWECDGVLILWLKPCCSLDCRLIVCYNLLWQCDLYNCTWRRLRLTLMV